MRSVHRLSITASLLAVTLAACGEAARTVTDDELSGADTVVVAEEMRFVDPPTELAAGTLHVALRNEGRAPHDLTLEGEHGTIVAASGGDADVATVELEPGTYLAYCAVPGHREAGMEFDLTVT